MIATVHPEGPTTAPPPRGPAGLSRAAPLVVFGQLAWLSVVWISATVAYAIVIACVSRWGEAGNSLWQPVASHWQRYLVFGAGISTMTTFVRMLVRNGATRSLLSSATTIAMAVIAAILAAWNVLGFTVERLVYDANGWTMTWPSGVPFRWGDLPSVAIASGLVVAAYYASGWIVGTCYYRWGPVGGTIRLLPALLPAAAMELVIAPDLGGAGGDVLASWRDRPAFMLVAGGAVLVASVWIARRLTRETALH